ncbi:MAG: excisionase family DNA-binding protein [Planctomycetes bacterium]|nr:excisionase family DNA-binding protein [Planctomycetota bacterium]
MVTMSQTLSGTYLTVAEAARHMGCTDGWVRMLILQGRLAATKMGQRVWMIRLEDATAAREQLTTRSNGKKDQAIRPAADRKPGRKAAKKRAKR